MGCDCEKDKKFPPAVLEIINPEQLVLLRKVLMPASLPEAENPPVIGKYRNVILQYEDTGHIYLYSSDGIPTALEASIPQEVLDRIADLEAEDVAINARIELEETNRAAADSALSSRIDSLSSSLSAETTAREQADQTLQTNIDNEAQARANGDASLNSAIANEATARQNADTNLQQQIDGITASSDVKDIVGTKAELNNYDTSTLGNNDIIKVLQDESEDDATTYYRWNATTQQFALIGEEGPYYTKSQADTLLNGKQDTLTAGTGIDITNDVISVTSTGPTVVQTTGTSTTDVMSQNAVTSMVFADPSTKYRVQIGSTASVATVGTEGIAIGRNSTVVGPYGVALGRSANVSNSNRNGSMALGAYSGGGITAKGMVDFGSSNTSCGYNSSNYRLLTGLYDPQSDHDAATKGYVDNLAITYAALNGTSAPTTATVGTYVGQLYLDTTNDQMHYLSAIDTTIPEYTWAEIGGSSVNVVQTIGASTTDVMSQDAVTKMVYDQDRNKVNVQIGGAYNFQGNHKVSIGADSTSRGDGSVAIGYESATSQGVVGAVALGAYSRANAQGQFDIGAVNTSYGYNSSNYRLLTGLYDPQNAHDAATKGYVDTAISGISAPTEFTTAEWNSLWA